MSLTHWKHASAAIVLAVGLAFPASVGHAEEVDAEEADTPDVILQVGRGFSQGLADAVANNLIADGCTVDFSEGGLPGRLTLESPSDGFKMRYKTDQTGSALATFDDYCPKR